MDRYHTRFTDVIALVIDITIKQRHSRSRTRHTRKVRQARIIPNVP